MPDNPYETDELLQQYLVFHYAQPLEQLPYAFGPVDALDFPKRCAQEEFFWTTFKRGHAHWIWGVMGRSTFELARHFGEVIGMIIRMLLLMRPTS